MTIDPGPEAPRGRRRWIVAAVLALGAGLAAAVLLIDRQPATVGGPTVGERVSALGTERTALQARADGEARIALWMAFDGASLMSSALAARYEADPERPFAALSAADKQAFDDADALNAAIRDALARPGEGARAAATTAAAHLQVALEHLAGGAEPLVLSFTPHFVAPRRGMGELTLAPRPSVSLSADPPAAAGFRLEAGVRRTEASETPTVPRYAPAFTGAHAEDPPVPVEVVGLHLAPSGGPRPTLSIGDWRGVAELSPERLHFKVPRSAFATDAVRTILVSGVLSIPHGSRSLAFELPFVVLPDRPGSCALDQKVRVTTAESKTLVSPEILARAAVGETRTVRRCFDPPPGWRFDKAQRQVVVVERLGWLNDVDDATLNNGVVEFAADERPDEICVVVTARPVTKTARTATIGRFEATLVHDVVEESTVQSGVRALDWREPVRIRLEPGSLQWKLYLRLFGEIDREIENPPPPGARPVHLLFLQIGHDPDGTVVLTADPSGEP